ncbi:hypothetical protein GGR54DRAFT_607613 [Hypoxylon sp. NC1633]|nr:hypothetical protein GGR54DRAFT_607613 [Hypoxylon sp. NC1633]
MCIQIYQSFRGCKHKVYQNTFSCRVVQRVASDGDIVLDKTKFLPDKPPRIPPGMLQCKLRKATRPTDTACPQCAKDRRREEQQRGRPALKQTPSFASTDPSTPPGKHIFLGNPKG